MSSSSFTLKHILSLLLFSAFASGQNTKKPHHLLQFGQKCIVPRQGGELSIVNECDASKGLVCNGKACVCTLPDYFAYDVLSDECRKKLGKSCRPTKDEYEHKGLPFHLKCHSTATCTVVARKMVLDGMAAGNSKDTIDGWTMCVCKYGYQPNDKLDGCHTPTPTFSLPPPFRNVGFDDDESEED